MRHTKPSTQSFFVQKIKNYEKDFVENENTSCKSRQKYEGKYFNNLNNDGVIIDGYDPVAFFTDNKPVKGNAQFQYEYEDADTHRPQQVKNMQVKKIK